MLLCCRLWTAEMAADCGQPKGSNREILDPFMISVMYGLSKSLPIQDKNNHLNIKKKNHKPILMRLDDSNNTSYDSSHFGVGGLQVCQIPSFRTTPDKPTNAIFSCKTRSLRRRDPVLLSGSKSQAYLITKHNQNPFGLIII